MVFDCQYCNKVFKTKQNLDNHINNNICIKKNGQK